MNKSILKEFLPLILMLALLFALVFIYDTIYSSQQTDYEIVCNSKGGKYFNFPDGPSICIKREVVIELEKK